MSQMNKYSNPLNSTNSAKGKKTMAYYLQTVDHAEKAARSPVSYMAGDKPKLVMRNFDATNFRSD